MAKEKLMVIDGNSILNRAFYGIKGSRLLSTSDGVYTNGVYGFLNIMFRYLNEENPHYLCVAFDLKSPTFRHIEFDGYKANRKGMPDELASQVPIIKEILDAMNVSRIECEGYEADDIIGSVSLLAEKKGLEVVIITGDRDALQLASHTTRIKLPLTRKGQSETDEFDFDTVVERYGITPAQLIDVKALMGDTSDNIPGVPGIGEKTALKLISEFKNIENLYDNLDQVDKKSIKEKLEVNKDVAFMSKKLAAIDRKMPELCETGDLRIKEYDHARLYDIFKRLEFKSFIEKLDLSPGVSQEVQFGPVICIREEGELVKLKGNIINSGSFALLPLFDQKNNFANQLTGMGVSWEKGTSGYIDLRDSANEDTFLGMFKDIFENVEIKKTGHDIKNFIVYLKSAGIDIKGIEFDTMLGGYILDPSRSDYSLTELAAEYLDTRIEPLESLTGKGKNRIMYRDIPLDNLSVAVGIHVQTVYNIRDVLKRMIKENNQEELYYSIELPLVEVLADMEYVGFKVNPEELKDFSLQLQERINSITAEIYMLVGEEFNINSPKQLGVILFEKLGLPIIKKTKTGYSTDADVLEKLESKHEVVSRILEYRQLAKLNSTYVEGLLAVLNPETGKIHSSFNQTVTTTGRISSTEPNLQNIPIKLEVGRKIRKVFVPSSPEYILLDADYSQIELRVLAHITEDDNLVQAFKNNEDIHTTTASKIFGVPMDQVTPFMRGSAKTVNFSIIYGIGEFSLSKDLGISRKEAKKYIDEYMDKYPGVKKYMHDIVEHGKETGYVTTLFNRRRYLPELKSRNFAIRSFGERIAMNTPIQGSAADIIKIAMVDVYREFIKRNMKSRLILQVHDELIVEAHVDEVDQASSILKDSMEGAVNLKVPLNIELKKGYNWCDTNYIE